MKNSIGKILIVIAISFLQISDLKSQECPILKNEMGIHFGSTTGMGLSYRHWFNNNGFQITAVPIKADYFRYYNAGITYLHSFYNTSHLNFYSYLAANYVYKEEVAESWWSEGYLNEKVKIGIGPAFSFGRVVRFNVMAGYGIYDINKSVKTYFAGEIGLYYSF